MELKKYTEQFYKTDHDKVLELHIQKNTNKEISDKLNITLYMVEKILSYYDLTPVKNMDKIDHQIVIDLYKEHRNISKVAKILEIEGHMVDKILIHNNITKRSSVTRNLDSTEVIRDYLECRDVNVVAQKYNVSLSPIIKILKNNGIKRKKNHDVYKRVVKNGHRIKMEIDVNYVIQLYKELGTLASVARELNIKDSKVRSILLKNNVELNVTLKYTGIGDVFGYLTVIKEIEPTYTTSGLSKKMLLCECKCGNTVKRSSSSLKKMRGVKSCGCYIEERKQKNEEIRIKNEEIRIKKKLEYEQKLKKWEIVRFEKERKKIEDKQKTEYKSYNIGDKKDRFTITGIEGKHPNMMISVICECGTEKVLKYQSFFRHKSCGCLRVERSTIHGHSSKTNPERRRWHDRWKGMIKRCYNPKVDSYSNYGGRGITVCDRWREPNGVGSQNYYEDIHNVLGPQPSSEHSLDRMDNDGMYEITNMRWATNSEQVKNQRRNIKS